MERERALLRIDPGLMEETDAEGGLGGEQVKFRAGGSAVSDSDFGNL